MYLRWSAEPQRDEVKKARIGDLVPHIITVATSVLRGSAKVNTYPQDCECRETETKNQQTFLVLCSKILEIQVEGNDLDDELWKSLKHAFAAREEE
eukprot:gene11628-biopygen16052